MVVTFYSFKGGVGRSMALVNVGEILANWGYRVVLCDWDLEAPGLERYLVSSQKDDETYKQEVAELLAKDGLMDILREYKETLTQPPSESQRRRAANSSEFTSQLQGVGDLPLRRPFSYTFPVSSATLKPRTGWLRLMTVGRRDGDANQERYAEIVRSFDWHEFYDKWAGDRYMELFRQDLESSSDIVLVDSRTGVTEQGGVCTHHLADLVVLLSAANQMNLEGTKWMARVLSDPRLEELRGDRRLQILPVASRIEWSAEKEELVDFENRFRSVFRRYIPDAVANPDTFLLKSEIPYIPFYSFKERVVAREPEERRDPRLYAAYETLADAIARFGIGYGKLIKLRSENSVDITTPGGPYASRAEGIYEDFDTVGKTHMQDAYSRLLLTGRVPSADVDYLPTNLIETLIEARLITGGSEISLTEPEAARTWLRAQDWMKQDQPLVD